MGQHTDQGIPAPTGTTPHPGPATLDDICNLQLLGHAISNLNQRVAANKETTQEVRTMVENVSQQVDGIANKSNHQHYGKKDEEEFSLFDGPNIKPLIPAPTSQATSLGASAIPINPTDRSLSRTPGGTLKPIKVKAPEPFKGGTGTEAKQWLACMNGWLRLSATQFNTEEDVVTFLLVNMEGAASSWALPHLANMGSNRATITTTAQFDTTFSQAFFNPDE
ncbi:hypothetical protein BN14_06385 [Rhizoctonia solani AG-1 IB]|uniref:Retrotransposon gag domain-containing protein n=1 Tax=Thanatephorus cucumeris (strain AG1-IB / isolate 7/3/14) TaxID=1108050 RepID=M5BYQ0_THACB|nr:hypothetical protein BN14_06385 [Rhizoctonia solani AG-1 IB]